MTLSERLGKIWRGRPIRHWSFALVCGVLLAAIVSTAIMFAALETGEPSTIGVGTIMLIMFVAPFVLFGGLSLAVLGRRRRIGKSLWVGASGVFVLAMSILVMSILPGFLHGPRHLFLGTVRGTVAEVAARRAAYVEIESAFVDISRIGTGTSTSTDKEGRTRSSSRSVAPIVTAFGEGDAAATAAEEVTLFVAGDRDDIVEAGRGNGTITGRVAPCEFNELGGIRELGERVRVAKLPRCVVPTIGGAGATGLLWLIADILLILVLAFVGAWMLLAVATAKSETKK